MNELLELERQYLTDKKSVKDISISLGCSVNKVIYWMDKYQIKRRSISDAIYQKNNPDGDPFSIQPIRSLKMAKLYGMGIGLYWEKAIKQINTPLGLAIQIQN